MSTVMWDLDGVATLWVPNFYEKLCEWNNLTPTEWDTWHHYRTHGIEDADFVKHLTRYADEGGFAEQTPVPGFSDAVTQLQEAGHTQHVVTDRPDGAFTDTLWWVDTFAPEVATVEFNRDKTVFKKQGPPTYYSLDDRTENVEALRKVGVYAYLLSWPWNADSDLPRVSSIEEFVNKVIRQANS